MEPLTTKPENFTGPCQASTGQGAGKHESSADVKKPSLIPGVGNLRLEAANLLTAIREHDPYALDQDRETIDKAIETLDRIQMVADLAGETARGRS